MLRRQEICFSCWAKGMPKDGRGGGEWLYDVTWCDSDRDGWLRSIPMVAEGEWGNLGDIDDDFQKLLVARAKIRVMVCDAGYADGGTTAIANRFSEWVGAFEGAQGDTYLLIAHAKDNENMETWRFEYATIVAQGSGQLPILQMLH